MHRTSNLRGIITSAKTQSAINKVQATYITFFGNNNNKTFKYRYLIRNCNKHKDTNTF